MYKFASLLLIAIICSLSASAQTDTLIMNSGSVGSVACSGVIYDNGGPNSNYTNNVFSTLFLQPTGANFVSITINEIDLEFGYDFLNIYDGPDTFSPLLASSGFGQSLLNETFMSTGPIMTIAFSSDYSVTQAGFELAFECVLLTQAPEPNFTYQNECGGQAQFFDETTNFPDTWLWDFGDGTTSDEQNPLHAYNSGGPYEVTLTASNSIGSSDVSLFIQIPEDEVVEFNIPDTAMVNQLLSFSYNDVEINNLVWDLGDGFINTNDSFVYSYQEPGTYLLTIDYLTSENCEISLQQNLEILQTVGISDLAKSSISVYPNPANQFLIIDMQQFNEEINSVSLFNAAGQLLLQKPINSNQTNIDISEFEKGCYELFLFNEKDTYQTSIIKQ